MTDPIINLHERVAALLSMRRRRTKLSVFVCALSLAVMLGVSLSLMRIGITKTHDVRELACPITAPVAHHHNADCYDEQGNLVCTLPEQDLHVHDDSCYEERTYLICDQEESEEHHHTDACYRSEKVLVCGKQECTTEHTHSDHCFHTVAVDDETGTRYQVLTAQIKEPDAANGKERVTLEARADVPEGALPEDASLKAERPGASEPDSAAASDKAKAVTDVAFASVAHELGEEAKATVVDSVALSFVASGDAESEPACDVTYRLTSDAIAQLDPTHLRVAAVDATTGKASLVESAQKVLPDDEQADGDVAPTVKQDALARSNTLELRAENVSALVVLDVDPASVEAPDKPAVTLSATTEAGTSVTLEAPEGALPAGATMGIADITSDEAARQVADAESAAGREVRVDSAFAVDVRFFDASGESVEPAVPVTLHIASASIASMQAPKLYLLPGNLPGSQASPMSSSLDATVGSAVFEAATSGSYAMADLVYVSGAALQATGAGYKVSVSYGADADIPEDATLAVSEIADSDAAHDDYVTAAEEALGFGEGTSAYARLLDISIMYKGKKVQPAKGADVDVRIELADADAADLDVVHFADGKTEGDVVPEVVTEAPVTGVSVEEGRSVSFATTGFSTYVIISKSTAGNQLNGRTFVLAMNGSNGSTALSTEPDPNDDAILKDQRISGNRLPTYSSYDQVTKDGNNNALTKWLFTIAGDSRYFIQPLDADGNPRVDDSGKPLYLSVTSNTTNNGTVALTTTPFPLRVTLGNNNTTIRIENDNNVAITLRNGTVGSGFGGYPTANNNNCTFTLYESLDDGTYAIVNTNIANQGFRSLQEEENGPGAAGNYQKNRVALRVTETDNGYVTSDGDITLWSFEYVDSNGQNGNPRYYIHLASDPNSYLKIFDEGRTNAGTSTGANATRYVGVVQAETPDPSMLITVARGNNFPGQVSFLNASGTAICMFGSNAANGFGAYANNPTNNQNFFTLYGGVQVFQDFYTRRLSVQELKSRIVANPQDKPKVLVYQAVMNHETMRYEYYAIDGNGKLFRVFDKGNEINGRSELTPFFEFSGNPDTNYYYLQNVDAGPYTNTATGEFLVPHANGDATEPSTNTRASVTLDGLKPGSTDYSSTIEAWDDDANCYYGFYVDFDENGNPVLKTGVDEGDDRHNYNWCFAEVVNNADLLPTYEHSTLDSVAMGITIKMYDFNDRGQMSNIIGGDYYVAGNHYNNSGLASLTLDANGWPYFASTGHSAGELFTDGNLKGYANHLFLQQPYEADGFASYSAFKNAAYYPVPRSKYDVADFKIYNGIEVPYSDGNPYRQRGNFMPFGPIGNQVISHNYYNYDATRLDPNDPFYGEDIYQSSTNYYFGMTLDFAFTVPKDGYYRGNPMSFQFVGDDDMWVYIDGVKILDLGGIHNGLQAAIDFSTGEIAYGINGYLEPISDPRRSNNTPNPWAELPTSIYRAYELAGVYPDGTAWNDGDPADYFVDVDGDGTYDTYRDFTTHSFKMIYAEHGAGSSNLDILFNLPTFDPDSFTVEKELDDAMQNEFSDREFTFDAKVLDNGAERTITPALIAENRLVKSAKLYKADGSEPVDLPLAADGTFKLGVGDKAVFSLIDKSIKYSVREKFIDDDVAKVEVDDGTQQERPASGEWGEQAVEIPLVSAERRVNVVYTNVMDDAPLAIEKKIYRGLVDPDDTFQFRVWIEKKDGEILPANKVPYTMWDKTSSGTWEQETYEVDGQVVPRIYYTGPNGTLNIKADQRAVISGLLRDTKYVAIEDRMPEGYLFDSIVSTNAGGEQTWWNDFVADGANNFWNRYGSAYADETAHTFGVTQTAEATDEAARTTVTASNSNGAHLKIWKVDSTKKDLPNSSMEKYIDGAHFELELGDPLYNWKHSDVDNNPHRTPEYDPDGQEYADNPVADQFAGFEWQTVEADEVIPAEGKDRNVKTGVYRLKETRPPAGYILTYSEWVYVKVYIDGTIELVDDKGEAVTDDRYDGVVDAWTEQDTGILHLYVYNTPGGELPKAGGIGIHVFRLLGTFVCLLAAAVYAKLHHRHA